MEFKKTYNLVQARADLEHQTAKTKRLEIFNDVFEGPDLEFLSVKKFSRETAEFWRYTPSEASDANRIANGLLESRDGRHTLTVKMSVLKDFFGLDGVEALRENRILFRYAKGKNVYYILPSSEFIATLVKCLEGSGKIFREAPSLIRDLFLAQSLAYAPNILYFICKEAKNPGGLFAYACVGEKYQIVRQTFALEAYEKEMAKQKAVFSSCHTNDRISKVNFIYPEEKLFGTYTPGIQFVFSDTADSSTIVRSILQIGNDKDCFIYLNESSFNHRLDVSVDTLLDAVRQFRGANNSFPLHKLFELSKKNFKKPGEAFKVFQSLCLKTGLKTAIGKKYMETVKADTKEYFSSIEESLEMDSMSSRKKYNESPLTYEEVFIEFISILTRYEFHSSAAIEKARSMMKNAVEFLYNEAAKKTSKKDESAYPLESILKF